MNGSSISVVLQGPVTPVGAGNQFDTTSNIENIRKVLPGCEIILATWENSDLRNIEVDKLIVLDDPGAVLFEVGSNKPNNINRMLISSRAGVEAATRDHILKIRTDLMPTSTEFLKVWSRLAVKPKRRGIFSRQLLAYPVYSLLFEGVGQRRMPKPFHVSDWAFFGLAEDVRKLFDVPTVKEPDYSDFFIGNEGEAFDTIPAIKWQYSPEQYLFFTAWSKVYSDVPFGHKRDYNSRNIQESTIAVFQNFIFIDPEMWGLHHDKKFYNRPLHEIDENAYWGIIQFGTCIRHRVRQRLKVSAADLIRGEIGLWLSRRRFLKHHRRARAL